MSTRSSRPLISFGVAAAQLARVAIALKTGWQRRRLLGQLGALDDHMLRDIGITRQDIVSSLAEPMFRDPTVHLAARALDARSARRAFALEARGRSFESDEHLPLHVTEGPIAKRAA